MLMYKLLHFILKFAVAGGIMAITFLFTLEWLLNYIQIEIIK